MFHLSLDPSSQGVTATGLVAEAPPTPPSLTHPGLQGLHSPFFLPPRWAMAPGLLTSGWPPHPLFAFPAFKTPGDELPLFNPGTWFWSGTRTFSATHRLRRQQENRGLGPSLLWVPCNAVWALPPQTQGWWPPFLLQPASGPGMMCGPWEAGHAPAGGRGTSDGTPLSVMSGSTLLAWAST